MLNACYNQITPEVKVSDLCQLVADGHLLRSRLSTLSTEEVEYVETMLDELGCNNPGDKGRLDEEFYAAYTEYSQIRRAALEILATR